MTHERMECYESFRTGLAFHIGLCTHSQPQGLPCLVERCVQYLEKEYVKGLFLTNGNAGNIRRVRQALKENADSKNQCRAFMSNSVNIHTNDLNMCDIFRSCPSADLVLLKTKFPQVTPLDVATVLCEFLRFVFEGARFSTIFFVYGSQSDTRYVFQKCAWRPNY